MKDNDELASVARIEAARIIHRRASEKCAERGLTCEEQAIAAAYATFDLAERHAGRGAAAIEWLRTACDVLERGLMDGSATC